MTEQEPTYRASFLICSVMLVCAVVFIALTLAAMFFYPGGTYINPATTGYSFAMNFFSDLGTTRTYSGASNTVSQVLFTIAMVLIGSAICLFGLNNRIIYFKKKKGKQVLNASIIVSCVTGVMFIGIALTPANLVLNMHIFFVRTAFSMLMLFIALTTIIQVKNGWEKSYINLNYAYFIILLCYLFVLFYMPSMKTYNGLKFNVISQKVIVYISIINIGIQSFGQIIDLKKKKALP